LGVCNNGREGDPCFTSFFTHENLYKGLYQLELHIILPNNKLSAWYVDFRFLSCADFLLVMQLPQIFQFSELWGKRPGVGGFTHDASILKSISLEIWWWDKYLKWWQESVKMQQNLMSVHIQVQAVEELCSKLC
jgi:hypothetical protein